MIQKYQLDRFIKLVHGFDTMDMRQEEFNEKDCQGNVGRYSYAPTNPIKKE
jgi:hypothetical protein